MEMTPNEKKKLLILAAVGLLFSVAFALVLNGSPAVRYRSDIYLRWYASEKLLAEGRNLYDPRSAEEVTTLVHGEARQTNYFYPAPMLLFTGPLALLPFRTAHLVWTLAGQLFYLAGLWIVARAVGWPRSVGGFTIFMSISVLFIPYFQHTIWSQFNTIGLLSLALCYVALRRGRYLLAGALATGLTFKPHTTVLALGFLLLWALFERRRWRFYLGFLVTGAVLWALAELAQPGWVLDFVGSLGGYRASASVLDTVWNPYQIPAAVLCLAVVAVVVASRRASPASPAFAGCLALSLVAWFLVVPAIGMMHAVLLPVAALLLLPALQERRPALYRPALYGLALVYLLGIAAFAWGLSSPERYGLHTRWSQMAYEAAAPILIGLFSIPLVLPPRAPQPVEVAAPAGEEA
ncbi:MAG: glycosyltransferase family 87 protein [Anaerolineae bacterium]